MKNFTKNSFLLLLAFAFIGFTITSCGTDEITGCMDETSNNYDPDATIDGENCEFDATKFIGSYFGESLCTGGPVVGNLTNDSLVFKILDDVDSDDPNDVKIELTIQGFPASFTSKVSGDVLTIDALLEDLTFPNPAGGTPATIQVNVKADGTETYDTATNSVSGDITIKITTTGGMGTLDEGTCEISGTKQ